MPVLIYTLNDPDTGEVRYVGKTSKTLEVRLRLHIATARRNEKRYSCNWIKSVAFNPKISLIDTVNDNEDWQKREQFWISKFLNEGARLTNLTSGGEGWHGLKHTTASKLKISLVHKGKVISEDQKQKLSKAMKGRKLSDDHKAKVSKAMQNRYFSPEHKAKISAAKKAYYASLRESTA